MGNKTSGGIWLCKHQAWLLMLC